MACSLTYALQLLALMDFEGKERIVSKVSENGTLYDRLLKYQQIALELAADSDPELADELAAAIEAGMTPPMAKAKVNSSGSAAESRMENARDAAQERSQPS